MAGSSAALLLLMALGLGGQLQGGGDAAVHTAGLAALALALWRWRWSSLGLAQRSLFVVLAGATALALLQLVPIPIDSYANLPGRAQIVAELRSAGLAPAFLPLSLDRWATVRAALALSTFSAMWMLCTTLSSEARLRLVKLAIVAALPLALLGFAQASLKADTTGATGFFANRNHYACLMAMLVPLAFSAARVARRPFASVPWLAAAVLLLLAAALSFSRAGFALACAAALAALVAGAGSRRSTGWLAPGIAALVALAAVAYFARDRLQARFASDPFTDQRWQYLKSGWTLLQSYLPWGSGFGSYPTVHGAGESTQALVALTPGFAPFARYAHNELLQLGIEAGWPGLLVLAAFLGTLAVVVAGLFRPGSTAGDWRRAAAIAALVPLLHSLVDYPLRTFACSMVLALLLSICLQPGRDGNAAGSRPA
jgi:O-antigen ligase